MKAKPSNLLPSSYAPLLADLKARVRAAQVKAALSVNRELILLYWHIGREILRAQKAEGWGTKVVQRLAKDLAAEFPEMSGFSSLNLKRMRAFYAAWAPVEIVQQAAAQLTESIVSQPVTQLGKAIVKQPVSKLVSRAVTQFDSPPEPLALLPWSTNLILLHKLKDPVVRLWYARKTLEHGWSRAVLTVQIETRLHERSGKAITNFDRTLPPAQSDLAREALKDPYTFDFLSLGEAAQERDLERGLVQHIQQFLVELGAGFAFVGRQVRIEVGGDEYALDLLFYHLRLRCFVVVDLKMKPFEPEFAGKMNFYLSAVDDQMRHPDDAPTIGLLLCKDSRNKLKIDAGAAPADIDYINAHGTSTSMNDRSETAAMRVVFGAGIDRVSVSSTKSTMGHLIAAAGAVEGVVCALAIARGEMPINANYTERDPDCDLNLVTGAPRRGRIRMAMSNSFGFGGSNSSIVFRHPDEVTP